MTIDLQMGDNREVLLKYPDKHFDCVVTSPPYWGLRDYNTAPLLFDDNPNCEHKWNEAVSPFCYNCGAWKGQLGLEPTPELFIRHLVDTFDIIKPKLTDTGNCFINIGDTYSANRGCQVDGSKQVPGSQLIQGMSSDKCGVPTKCLCLIPERFAWGMIEHGWILRNKIVWNKKNNMPESVTDRLTKSHEIVYHFVKQQKYYYNLDAIRSPLAESTLNDIRIGCKSSRAESKAHKLVQNGTHGKGGIGDPTKTRAELLNLKGKNPGDVLELDIDDLSETELKFEIANLKNQWASMHPEDWSLPTDVWQINTQPYSKAHFATFPLKLVEKPILAGCPVDGLVLDPFAGSGTVGEFCNKNHRNAVLIELNEEYKPLIVDRTNLKQIPLSEIFSFVR